MLPLPADPTVCRCALSYPADGSLGDGRDSSVLVLLESVTFCVLVESVMVSVGVLVVVVGQKLARHGGG